VLPLPTPRPLVARILPALALALLLAPRAAFAVPPLLNYQGFLADNAGQPMNGSHVMQFEMFADSTGGAALWSEAYAAVTVSAGVFNVLLGSVTPLPVGTLFTGNALWLQTTVDGSTLLPRRPIVSVAYALRAENADMRAIARAQGYSGDNTDNGVLAGRTVTMTKKYATTGVRVGWSDNFGVSTLNNACRWEVLFNGVQCTNPGAVVIDKYEGNTGNVRDPASMFGTCFRVGSGVFLPAGTVIVTTRVYPSPGYAGSDCYTGWNSQLWSLEAEEVR
jgi:hypothetical protein